jgi:3-dehydroquinate dehydratase-2
MKILILNGPNLNKLAERNPKHYGEFSLEKINRALETEFPEHSFSFFQSNGEGQLIDKIQEAEKQGFEGIIINPGGYAHSSVALRDALELTKLPKIEVHLSNLSTRENFRQNLITATACNGYISGFKEHGYFAAVYLLSRIAKKP